MALRFVGYKSHQTYKEELMLCAVRSTTLINFTDIWFIPAVCTFGPQGIFFVLVSQLFTLTNRHQDWLLHFIQSCEYSSIRSLGGNLRTSTKELQTRLVYFNRASEGCSKTSWRMLLGKMKFEAALTRTWVTWDGLTDKKSFSLKKRAFILPSGDAFSLPSQESRQILFTLYFLYSFGNR